MKRLTERRGDGTIIGIKGRKGNFGDISEMLERLAEYEDIGLTPEEIAQLRLERNAAVNELGKNLLGRAKTCANYGACYKKAYDSFKIMPCITDNCPGWQWRGIENAYESK